VIRFSKVPVSTTPLKEVNRISISLVGGLKSLKSLLSLSLLINKFLKAELSLFSPLNLVTCCS
jgi:hypothetical protein